MSTSKSNIGFWRTSNGLAAIGLILLLCPVMHIFMHRQHGHEGAQDSDH